MIKEINNFYKIIHNKYLFNYIFNLIHTVDWIQYDNISDINVNNRKRFKDIVSMNWMLKNKQYSLLKCKLENGEFIEINEHSLELLFETGSGLLKSKKPFIFNGNNEPEKEIVLEKDIEIIHQVLILLLNNKKEEISQFELLEMSIRNKDLIGTGILINEPYSYQITPSILKLSIEYSTPIITESIINSKQLNLISKTLVPDQFKLNINQMYQLIENEQLVIKLLENGYFKFQPLDNEPIFNEDQINKLIPTFFNGNITKEVLKEIYKLLTIAFKSQFECYKQYFYKYKETIDGLDSITVMTEYCLEMFDVEILKQLLSSNGSNNSITYSTATVDQKLKKPTLEFILLYCSQDLLKDKVCKSKIIISIMDIQSKDEYESLVNQLVEMNTKSSKSILSRIPTSWSSIYSDWKVHKKVIIKCKEDVEWIIDNIRTDKFTKDIFMNNYFDEIIQIESWELVDYSINKFNDDAHFSSYDSCEHYYKYPLNKAIKENNMESFIQNCGNGQINLPKILNISIINNSFDIVLFILEFYSVISDFINFDKEWIKLEDKITFDSFFSLPGFRKMEFIEIDSNPDTIIKCIAVLINQLNSSNNDYNKGIITIFQDVIDSLYRKLIQSSKTTFDKIKYCVNLIVNSKYSFKIEHTNYHSFCYLVIRSIKFKKYLLKLPFLNGYFIEEYIDSSIFSMELIFQSSFDEILFRLINQSLFAPSRNIEYINENIKFLRKSLNYNLYYLLEIKRKDLFFILLDKIENKLQDPTFYNGDFPTTLPNNLVNRNIINQSNNSNSCCCNQIIKPILNNRVFKLSKKVTFGSFKLFNNDESSFQKFISFSSYYSIIKTVYKLGGPYIKKILKSNQFEIIIHFYYYHFRTVHQCYQDINIGKFFWNLIKDQYYSNEMVHLDKQLLNLINNYSLIYGSDRIIDKNLISSIKSITNNRINSLNILINKLE